MTTELLSDVPIKMLLITRTKDFETPRSHVSISVITTEQSKAGPDLQSPRFIQILQVDKCISEIT